KSVVIGRLLSICFKIQLCPVASCLLRPSVVNEVEQQRDGLIDEVTLAGLLRLEANHLKLAQALQAVTVAVGFRLHRRVPELRPRLDIEEEEHAVHVPETLQRELSGIELLLAGEDAFLSALTQVPYGLVAEQLDGLTEGILKVLRNGKGMFVG